jgi:predicted dehydrogenase
MRRFVLVGAGARALHQFALPLAKQYAGSAVLAGVYDLNSARAAYVGRACGSVPAFDAFDEMLRAARPDCVIVATIDRTHHEYIIRALDAGCEVISEKPLTIDAEKCRVILAAERRSGRRIAVTFNLRFVPYVTRIKELLRDGAIGRVLNADLEWYLDRRHGADYFRRWHRRKENSGGLLVHKATHHFDMINWWLDQEPERVFAFGRRHFYGPTRAERGERCSTCAFGATCDLYVNYSTNPLLHDLYFAAEAHDGYYRDRCVFDEEIDIEDTMTVAVRYEGGAQLSYSLVAYSPYEGWRATLTGTDGRLEAEMVQSGPDAEAESDVITVYDTHGSMTRHAVSRATGEHGGADALLRDRLFSPGSQPDPLGHMAGSRAGALSLLIGAAANQSMADGLPVNIAELLGEAQLESG